MFRMLILCIFCCVCVSCSSSKAQEKPKKKERICDFQKRTFPLRDQRQLMKAVLRVLQEDCYVIKHMALDLGFISAIKENITEHSSDKFWMGVSKGEQGKWEQQDIADTTISMYPSQGQTVLRAHFQIKKIDNKGTVMSIEHIQERTAYEEFFNRVTQELTVP